MKKISKILSVVLVLTMIFGISSSAYSAEEMTGKIQNWLTENIKVQNAEGAVDSYIDWTVFATAMNGNDKYNDEYKAYISDALESAERLALNDYARISLAAMSIGMDPTDIGGKNLIDLIEKTDFSQEAYTGALAYALIALKNAKGDYSAAQDKIKDILISAQRADGGFNAYVAADEDMYWTLDGETDSTGIVLQAFAMFKDEDGVSSAVSKAIDFIKKNQMDNGAFGSWGSASAESISMILAALCELGIDPEGADFTKGESTMITALSDFINEDGGGRCWDGSSNALTSYEILIALDSYNRFKKNDSGVFSISALERALSSVERNEFLQKIPFLGKMISSILSFIIPLMPNYYVFK